MKQVLLKLIVTGFVAAFANTSNAFASPWCHVFLKATDGTELQIDYQVGRQQLAHSPDLLVMGNLYTHVKNEAFAGSEDVSMVLMNPVNGYEPSSSQTLRSLPFDGQRFTGKASDLANGRYTPYIKYDFPNYASFHLEIAVVVNGVWLKNPLSGESNFKLFPEHYPNMCAHPF